MLKRLLLVLVLSVTCISLVFARVNIPVKQRMANRKPGYCMWCCVEAMCNYLGYKQGRGLVDWYVSQPDARWGAWPFEVEEQLQELGVPFASRHDDFGWVCRQSAKDRPVLITFKKDSPMGAHACILIDVKDGWVEFIDPNDIGRTYVYSEEDFKEYWAGYGLVILPKR